MRLSKEEYKEAKGCLKRYNYNCISIMNIRADILSIGSQVIDGLPKAPYRISDNVLNSVIRLHENDHIQKCVKEIKAVQQALALLNEDSRDIFEKQYRLGQSKWEILDIGMSEGTYKRRHSDLVYAVHNELKKVRQK